MFGRRSWRMYSTRNGESTLSRTCILDDSGLDPRSVIDMNVRS